MIGLLQTIRLIESGNNFKCYLNADCKIDYANRDYRRDRDRPEVRTPIALLDEGMGTIMDIRVNLKLPVTDPMVQQEIHSALKKISFNVKYRKGPEFYKSKSLIINVLL